MLHISTGGGGGGSAPAPVVQKVDNTSIPSYAQPYVESMLGQTAALTDINQNPYQNYVGQRIAGFTPMQAQGFQNVANQQVAGQVGEGSDLASASGAGMLGTTTQAGQYGNIGNTYGGMAASMAPQAQQYGATGSAIGTTGGLGYGSQGAGYGAQASQAGNQYAQMATNPYATQAYMNPYLQSSLAPQLEMMDRQNAQTQQKNQAQAVGQGAFGGNRGALVQSQNDFYNNLAKQNLIGQGYNTAFNSAQQAQQFGANLGLQGQQTGIQGAQAGLAGVNAAMQGQQLGLSGLQQAGNLYGQGMTGAQIGLQGVGAQQAGYAGANQAASTLGQLGQTQFGQEQAITSDINKAGAVQQAQQQQGLDVQYQDYLKQKNYPYQQLAFQSDMLRGLPLSQAAQTQYAAAPNTASQAGGLGMSALGIYGMSGGFKAKGGMVGNSYAKGGQVGYKLGGDIKMMSTQQLTELLDNPSLTPMEVSMVEEQLMLRKRIEGNPEAGKIMAPAERSGIGAISTGDMVPEQMAGGGIIAFAQGGPNKESYQSFLENQVRGSIEKQLGDQAFAKSDAEKAKLEAAIASRQERSPYEALAMAGLQTMAGTSPYALTNLGLGATEGLKSYSKSAGADVTDRQKLLESQIYADKAEDARKSALTGQMQTTLGSLYAKQAAQAAAGSGSEEKALLRVQALINQDDQLPLLYKQRDMYEPSDAKYKAYNDAINSIKKTYFEQAGIKRPFIAPAGVQLPPEPEKESILSRLNPFSSKPTAPQSKTVPFSSLPQ